MSVVGFDLGNQNAYIAVVRSGGVDVLINDYSLHATPTCVSFGPKSRSLGVAARNQISTNIKNTVLYFKHLIGRKFDDPLAQQFLKHVPCPVTRGTNGEILFQVNYLGETHQLSVEQITAAFLVKLKLITEAQTNSRVSDVVISVPPYFTDIQRQSLLNAGVVAGINVLKIVNEDVAVGIAYGIYKKGQLPAPTEKGKLVAFIDIGHSVASASLIEFHERQARIVESVFDLNIGGFHFDQLIREQFGQQFQNKYKINAKSNPRAWLRLLDESEKLKKQMSANTTRIPLNIECFMDDVDVSGAMDRAEFEQLAEPVFQRFRILLDNLIKRSGVDIKDISEVEVIGGSSRIPFIKQIIAHHFNREPKTTMNADDVVARGAAMQCAILSPTVKVTDFNVVHIQPYNLCVNYVNSEGVHVTQTVFKRKDEFPLGRVLPLHKTDPFTISAFYEQSHELPQAETEVGTWQVQGVTKPDDAPYRVVRVKLQVDHNGVFSVRKALYEELAPPEPEPEVTEEPMDTADQNKPEATAENANGTEKMDAQPPAPEQPAEKKEKKPKKVVFELPIVKLAGYNIPLGAFVEFEKRMQEVDLNEQLKSDAKNAVEEYVYNMREKLSEQFAEFVTDEENDQFRTLLTDTEDWLYGDGEDAERDVYEKKLVELRETIEPPINKRQREKFDQEEIARNLEAEKNAAANPQAPEVEPPQ